MKTLDKIRQAIREERYRLVSTQMKKCLMMIWNLWMSNKLYFQELLLVNSLATLAERAMKLLVKPLMGVVPV